jgi:CHAD domain-containing protein
MTLPATEETNPTVNEQILAAFDQRWEKYRMELDHCRDEFSNDAIHDLRVATRRMLAFVELWKSIAPRPRLKKLKRAFKDQLDEFDELRDTQVILETLGQIGIELPQLQEFQMHLRSRETDLFNALRKRVDKFDLTGIKKQLGKTRKSIEKETDDELIPQIFCAVDRAFLRVRQRQSNADVAHPATIHRVRVAFKAFRYMVEVAAPLLPNFPDKNFKRMNDYQSRMGEIQDAEVFTDILSDFTKRASLSNPEPVRRYEERRHTDALSAYKNRMDRLDTFWRLTPDQPFPWEKTGLS